MKRKRFGLLVNWFSKSCLLGVVYHRVSTGDAELVLIDLGCGGSLRCDGVPSRPPLTKLLNVQNLGIQRDCSGTHKPLVQNGITQPLVNPSQMLFGPAEVKSASRLNRESKAKSRQSNQDGATAIFGMNDQPIRATEIFRFTAWKTNFVIDDRIRIMIISSHADVGRTDWRWPTGFGVCIPI